MIHSIKRFLFVGLVVAIIVASLITAIGNYFLDKRILTPYLDEQVLDNFVYVTLIACVIFALLAWFIISFALRSMTRLGQQISNRASTHLEPVNVKNIPIEIKPLVDELNKLLEQLKVTLDRNKRFVADTAHELRTPLAALKTQAQVALNTNDEDAHQQALHKVIQGVDRCSHVVTQLLTLSRLRQEESLNDTHPLNLFQLTTEVLTHLVPIALEKNIDIELAPPPAEVKILGNEVSLGILIRNLVDNAIRYTPPKGSIKIEILDQDNLIILRFTDTGSGIPVELHERVFDRFYRILGTQQTGSGLGLAIVKQIAELHHAVIRLSTPASGIGLQVDVQFAQIQHQ